MKKAFKTTLFILALAFTLAITFSCKKKDFQPQNESVIVSTTPLTKARVLTLSFKNGDKFGAENIKATVQYPNGKNFETVFDTPLRFYTGQILTFSFDCKGGRSACNVKFFIDGQLVSPKIGRNDVVINIDDYLN